MFDTSTSAVAAPQCVQATHSPKGATWPLHLALQTMARPALAPGQVRLGLLAMTINPADLLQLNGQYGSVTEPPYTPGHESVAVVLETASDVMQVQAGEWVLPTGAGGHWRDEWVLPARQVMPIPKGKRAGQAAMLQANPATAWVMLHHLGTPRPGDWVLQNAANSAVGQCVSQIAHAMELRSINLVRRAQAIPAQPLPGSHWLVDDGNTDLPAAIDSLTGAHKPMLALDAIGGEASERLAASLHEGGCLLNYGLLSGEAVRIAAHDLVFRDIRAQGFWLARWMRAPEHRAQARDMYQQLVRLQQHNRLHVAIEAHYPLQRVQEAVAHAARPHRQGKILLTGAWLAALKISI